VRCLGVQFIQFNKISSDLIRTSINLAVVESQKSVSDAVFKYKKWFCLFDFNIMPCLNFLKILKKNSGNIIQCMVFYEKLRPRYLNKGVTVSEYDKQFLKSLAINGGNVRLKTMQSSRIARFVCL